MALKKKTRYSVNFELMDWDSTLGMGKIQSYPQSELKYFTTRKKALEFIEKWTKRIDGKGRC